MCNLMFICTFIHCVYVFQNMYNHKNGYIFFTKHNAINQEIFICCLKKLALMVPSKTSFSIMLCHNTNHGNSFSDIAQCTLNLGESN